MNRDGVRILDLRCRIEGLFIFSTKQQYRPFARCATGHPNNIAIGMKLHIFKDPVAGLSVFKTPNQRALFKIIEINRRLPLRGRTTTGDTTRN